MFIGCANVTGDVEKRVNGVDIGRLFFMPRFILKDENGGSVAVNAGTKRFMNSISFSVNDN